MLPFHLGSPLMPTWHQLSFDSNIPPHASVPRDNTTALTTDTTAGSRAHPCPAGGHLCRGGPEIYRGDLGSSAEPRQGPTVTIPDETTHPHDGVLHRNTSPFNNHIFSDRIRSEWKQSAEDMMLKSSGYTGTNRLEGDHGMGLGRLSPGLAHYFSGGSSHPLDDLQLTPLRMLNANNLKYSNPIMDPYQSPHIRFF